VELLGIVVGLRAEGDCLDTGSAADRPEIRCAGAWPDAATAAAQELIDFGCGGLMSFGLAGGLIGGLKPGDVVLADGVITAGGERLACDRDWSQRLHGALGQDVRVAVGLLLGVDRPLTTPAAKRKMAADTGALAVDMESHRVAAVAQAAGIPFAGLRAVCDGVGRAVPGWLAASIDREGRARPFSVACGLVRRPWELVGLVSLARDAARGYASLRSVALGVGPLFQFQFDR
jgi:adenosylhomocysteine nucleosidase